MKPIVVIGSGMAGYTLIRELRKLDSDIQLTLITHDTGDYYSKPMLSNALAQGKDAANLVITRADEMTRQLGIKLYKQCDVLAIDRSNKRVETTQGVLEYEQLILALGADPIRIPLEGDAADTVLSVNDIADYTLLRQNLDKAQRITILGGGLIGCEFANDLASAGYSVSIIDPSDYPLASLMPQQAGESLQNALTSIGVTWHFETSVRSINLDSPAYTLTLANGKVLNTDVVLSAIGLRPRIALAKQAKLAVNRGIVTNAYLRSSDANIFSLGDCAEIDGKVQPFVLPIMHSARALAKTLTGTETPVNFPPMPVVVKTPAHPIAVLPVARDTAGSWHTLADEGGIKQIFLDIAGHMIGFVLTGRYATERNEMSKRIGLQWDYGVASAKGNQ